VSFRTKSVQRYLIIEATPISKNAVCSKNTPISKNAISKNASIGAILCQKR